MRNSLALLLLLASPTGVLVGCKQVFDLEGYTPPAGPSPEAPFSERVLGTTRAGTIVAATRDGLGFPDATIELRLYLRGVRFAEGLLELNDWDHALSYDASTSTYRFELVSERCIVDDEGARCTRIAPSPP